MRGGVMSCQRQFLRCPDDEGWVTIMLPFRWRVFRISSIYVQELSRTRVWNVMIHKYYMRSSQPAQGVILCFFVQVWEMHERTNTSKGKKDIHSHSCTSRICYFVTQATHILKPQRKCLLEKMILLLKPHSLRAHQFSMCHGLTLSELKFISAPGRVRSSV